MIKFIDDDVNMATDIKAKTYLPRLARLNTIASAPNLIVLVLKPFPSVEQTTTMKKQIK